MGLASIVAGDAAISFLWVLSSSYLGAAAGFVAPYLRPGDGGHEAGGALEVALVLALLLALLTVFDSIASGLGGASFNPLVNLMFYVAGEGSDTVLSLGSRVPAQTLGAAAGALAARGLAFESYKRNLGGPKLGPGVDVATGAVVEAALTGTINLIVLWAVLACPANKTVKTAIMMTATVIVVVLGMPYSGPGMNPANAFGWAYVEKTHNTWEHFYIYWAMPTVSTLAAAWLFRLLLKPRTKATVVKEKEA
eukprot:SM000093S24434  [mRNA]  locus=s93:385193:386415:- [translate_table: standard]